MEMLYEIYLSFCGPPNKREVNNDPKGRSTIWDSQRERPRVNPRVNFSFHERTEAGSGRKSVEEMSRQYVQRKKNQVLDGLSAAQDSFPGTGIRS